MLSKIIKEIIPVQNNLEQFVVCQYNLVKYNTKTASVFLSAFIRFYLFVIYCYLFLFVFICFYLFYLFLMTELKK